MATTMVEWASVLPDVSSGGMDKSFNEVDVDIYRSKTG